MLSAQNIQTGNKMNKIALAAIFLSGVLLLSIFSVSASASQADELEKAMKVMRILTGHQGTCTDLDADGSGKVAAGDAVLALQKAANVDNTTCGDGWTIIGDIPEYSFSSEPIIDENTAFTMNVDPSNQLMLTAVTTNGWTIEYFAVKNQFGAPVSLLSRHAKNNDNGEYFEIKMDSENRPVSIEQQSGKILVMDWDNCTIYEEKDSLSVEKASIFNTISSHSQSDEYDIRRKIDDWNREIDNLKRKLKNIEDGIEDAIEKVKKFADRVRETIEDLGEELENFADHFSLPGDSLGDPHIYTIDRLKYDFQAVGEFFYLQSTQDPTEMSIQMRQQPWPNSKYIATNKAVAMSVGGDIVEINVENTPRLSINNTPVTMADKEVRQLSNGCKIYAENQWRYWVIWKDNSMAEVRTYSSHLDISVFLPDNRKGLVRGLLGNSDGDKTNDLQTRDGGTTFDIANKLTKDELYNQFGNSWRISQEESLFTYAEGEDTATYTDLNFPYALVTADDLSETVYNNAKQICLDAGITNPILLQDCILDVGLTGDSTFADNMKDLTPPEQSITVTDDWLLYEDAQKTEGEKIIRITADAAWQTGMALREGALNLDGDFEKTFTIYMGANDNGADGMVFIMLPELTPAGTSLNGGGGLGFSSACDNKPCFGVEIDTYRNSSDPSEDHVALIKNGSVNHNSTENAGLPVATISNIEDDATHTLTVSWNKAAQVFSVVLDGTTVITHEGLDIKTLLGTSTASYGFVGATGSATNEQYFYPVMISQ